MVERLQRVLSNPVSYTGAIIAVMSFVILVVLILTHVFLAPANAYVGVVTYLVFPTFLILGILLIPVGMIFEWRRRRRGAREDEPRFPVVDLNLPHHRHVFLTFIVGGVLFIMVSAVGSYNAYHFTESATFCGKLCHEVMHPEYTAYQASPHARVPCAECHIGAGADWFVKSKLSGMYQVYAALTHKYPQPIPTPVKNLRPSRETCEQCHWPEQFYGNKQKLFTHYLPDEDNTKYELNMLIKVGGGSLPGKRATGVHWHTFLTHDIEFISSDERLQSIPMIRSKNNRTGEIKVYVDEENPPSEELLASAPRHLMDCMDCHNRPTHIFRTPNAIMNKALSEGRIDRSLPMIKSIGVELLSEQSETTDEAVENIAGGLWDFYKESYPSLAESKKDEIATAAGELQARFRESIFPEMRINGMTYPDNIGHLYFPGCFRCHDGRHVTEYGERLSRDCNVCHVILSQEVEGQVEETLDPGGLAFRHPVDIDEAWREMLCYECHSE